MPRELKFEDADGRQFVTLDGCELDLSKPFIVHSLVSVEVPFRNTEDAKTLPRTLSLYDGADFILKIRKKGFEVEVHAKDSLEPVYRLLHTVDWVD